MEKKTEENNQEKKEIKIKYKTVMELIIVVEVIILISTILYGFLK